MQQWDRYHIPQNKFLLLNADKPEVMMIGTPTQQCLAENIGTVTVAETSLTLYTQVKSLGVIFDPKLTFNSHVSAVYKACNYHIWALQNIWRVLLLDVAKTLVFSIVGSRLDYCNSLLYSAPNWATAKLQRMQNCFAHVVLQRWKTCHAQLLPESLHWLPISHRINFKLPTSAYKIPVHSTSQLTYLDQLLPRQFTGSSVSLCSLQQPLLQVPQTWTAYGSRAFSMAFPNIWNKLPADVLAANNLPLFLQETEDTSFHCRFRKQVASAI